MKRSAFVVGFAVVAASALLGCAGNRDGQSKSESVGTLNLPLATQGASGVTYRLRDASFSISGDPWGGVGGGFGTAGSGPGSPIYVSSETDPDAPQISVELEEGSYFVQLLPGWRLEKVEGGLPTDVEATLLNGDSQWVWVSRLSSSWVEYQFGIGGREIWLNGDLNINIRVFEDPSELGYGGSGIAGSSPVGGTGGAGVGGSPGTAGTGIGGSPGTAGSAP